ncbi:MAG: recombinase family protein [Phycisphaeraceae bacterium]|nr:recombinase family protein [Phycisphaeraceae bacterium]
MSSKSTATRPAIGYLHGAADQRSAQRLRLAEHARNLGLTLETIHDDEDHEDRPGLEQAQRDAIDQHAVLIVDELSVLARSAFALVRLALRLHDGGADLLSIRDNLNTAADPAGIFFAAMRALSHLDLERQKMRFHAPFGYKLADDGQHIVPIAAEQQVIRQIMQGSFDGRSHQAIADTLNQQRVESRDSERWNADKVKQVVDHVATSRWIFPEPAAVC